MPPPPGWARGHGRRAQVAELFEKSHASVPALVEGVLGFQPFSAAALTFVGGTLAPANAAYIMAAGCFLSEPTLIHTDARCGNIFLSADGVKFIDFRLLKGGPRAAMDVAYMIFQNMGAADAEAQELELIHFYHTALVRGRLETWHTSLLTVIDHPLANCCPLCCREGLRSSTRRGQVARLPVEQAAALSFTQFASEYQAAVLYFMWQMFIGLPPPRRADPEPVFSA